MIYSEPYPHQGTDQCPSIYCAEIILSMGEVGHPGFCEKLGLSSSVEIERLTVSGQEHPFRVRLKSGLGIRAVRKAIARAWEMFSKRERYLFHSKMLNAAIGYVEEIEENMQKDGLDTTQLTAAIDALMKAQVIGPG